MTGIKHLLMNTELMFLTEFWAIIFQYILEVYVLNSSKPNRKVVRSLKNPKKKLYTPMHGQWKCYCCN